MFYPSPLKIPTRHRGHTLTLPRQDDIPVYQPPQPISEAGKDAKAQAKTVAELRKQIDKSKGWL